MKLNPYIKEVRKISITKAAAEIGITKQWVSKLCSGSPGGKKLARVIQNWSGGYVTADEIMFPDD